MGYISQYSDDNLLIAPVRRSDGKYDIQIKKDDSEVILSWHEQDHLRKIAASVNKLNIEACGFSEGSSSAKDVLAPTKAKAPSLEDDANDSDEDSVEASVEEDKFSALKAAQSKLKK